MTSKIYCVLDNKVRHFLNPFLCRTEVEARRAFAQVAQEPKSQLNQYPADFDLYCLGEFDQDKGTFKNNKKPDFVENALNVIPKEKQDGIQEELFQGDKMPNGVQRSKSDGSGIRAGM